jgi:hypothetical protein
MHRYDDMALAALLMFMPVEAASSLGQPFSERRAFHRRSPFDMTRSGAASKLPLHRKHPIRDVVSAAVDLRQSRKLGEMTILDRKIEKGVAGTTAICMWRPAPRALR